MRQIAGGRTFPPPGLLPMRPLWVVMPAGRRPEVLAEQISNLERERRSLGGRRLEVVLLQDSPPETIAPPRRRSWLRPLRVDDFRRPGLARDAAIRASPSDAIIVELDGPCLFEPRALSEIEKAFGEGAFLVLGAAFDAEPVGLAAYRRSLYDEVGGYSGCGDARSLWSRMESRLRGRRVATLRNILCKAAGYEEPVPPDFSDVEEICLFDSRVPQPKGLRISAVVPLYRSEKFVGDCLRSLQEYLPSDSEIVAVDDGSPDDSARLAMEVLASGGQAVLVRLSRNTGFAHAVNVGARLSRGKYLLLFNADALAMPGFVGPMLELMEADPSVAVVGNRHVRPGSGAVDSEGSEFSWQTRSYRHVGRDVPEPFSRGPAVSGPVERDMVTFACALVRGEVWRELGGLDERYLKAYWEDADFCMRVRAKGLRILYTPLSEISHVGGQSGAGGRPEYAANARLFRSRWVDTGLVDKFRRSRGLACHEGRVVCCMIACSEEEFIAAAIESVYELADKIVVVEGGTRCAVRAGLADEFGRSLDRTVEILKALPDPAGKLEVVCAPGRPWHDKRQMRQEYVKRLRPGDWMLLLDADEVFTEEGLWRLSALMHGADVVCPGFFLFWNNLRTLGVGRWDDFHQVKAVRWREGFGYWRDHNMPTDRNGTPVTAIPGLRVVRTSEKLYCHYSWAGKADEKLARKCAYYVEQNGPDMFPPDYFERVFLAWRRDPARVEREFGTHPYGGGGAAPFRGEHPVPVRRLIEGGRLAGV